MTDTDLKSLTLPQIELYLQALAELSFGEDEYVANLTTGFVVSRTRTFRIIIPPYLLTDITLEEV